MADKRPTWAKITNSMSKHDITETWMKRQAARAEIPEVCLVVEGNSLLVDKKELFAQSPVFERLSKTVFGKREQQIVIKGKRRKDVVNFLRCTMPGVLEPMNSENVHRILPMAFEYQAKNTLKRADDFLAEEIQQIGDNLSSSEIVKKILEAEKYNLMEYLKTCVMLAAKRRFKSLLACKDFYRITEKTKLEMRFKRWKDVEIVSDVEADLTQNFPHTR
ncbi:uncharacterized protein LOC134688541 isoform X1 [Mytilus trossulus]|uniref:uncharacterized protein LOC134688541 isoform X1 n=2 Tax=Mytilus trossulus TaxID=6551 RepID=UPI003003B782